MREYSCFDSRNATTQTQVVDNAKGKPAVNSRFFADGVEFGETKANTERYLNSGFERIFGCLQSVGQTDHKHIEFQLEDSACGSSSTLTFVL
jgi:hypothetical protein